MEEQENEEYGVRWFQWFMSNSKTEEEVQLKKDMENSIDPGNKYDEIPKSIIDKLGISLRSN